jgi:hypothetical protein
MRIDAKAAATTFGTLLAGLIWFILAKASDAVAQMGGDKIAIASGLTASILAAAFGYRIWNEASPQPGIDPKMLAGSLAAAAAGLLWFLLAAFVDAVGAWPAEDLQTVVAATATLLAGVLAYFVPNAASPVPGDGARVDLTQEEITEHNQIAQGGGS